MKTKKLPVQKTLLLNVSFHRSILKHTGDELSALILELNHWRPSWASEALFERASRERL